jgi:S-adenosylmethionine decarboxylase
MSTCRNVDEFPRDVKAFHSMWSGSDEVALEHGLEKRFEVDTTTPVGWMLADFTAVVGAMECDIKDSKLTEDILYIVCDRCVIVALADRVVITANYCVALHKAITPLMDLISAKESAVQWSSFMRKNTASPWSVATEDTLLAVEYSNLKECFPAGNSFLLGPLDAVHYFYFVYDNIDRSVPSAETDLQVNVVLHNTQSSPRSVTRLGFQPTSKTGEIYHRCATNGSTYEVSRLLSADGVNSCCYESNGLVTSEKIDNLVRDFKPTSFSVTALVDVNCPTPVNPKAMSFEGYQLENCASNEFAHGCTVVKTVYSMA